MMMIVAMIMVMVMTMRHDGDAHAHDRDGDDGRHPDGKRLYKNDRTVTQSSTLLPGAETPCPST